LIGAPAIPIRRWSTGVPPSGLKQRRPEPSGGRHDRPERCGAL